jgi:hypothetical protein
MEQNTIINFWGKASLRRWPEASLRDAQISSSTKSFLAEVGLPDEVGLTMQFGPEDGMLPRLTTRSHCLRIGFDDIVPICVDEEGAGRVVAVEEEDKDDGPRFINSSVERFGECLVHYEQYRRSVRDVSEAEALRLVGIAEEQMRKADPGAFGDPENWWPIIVEQMNHGLL